MAGHKSGDGCGAAGEAEGPAQPPAGSNVEECGEPADIWMGLGLFLAAGYSFLLGCAKVSLVRVEFYFLF